MSDMVTDAVSVPELNWRVTVRPWSYGYENNAEEFGSALVDFRRELGIDDNAALSAWIYEATKDRFGQGGCDVPVVLLDAFEYPSLGWGDSMYVIEALAQALKVSPGTLIDELWLRTSGTHREDGTEIPEEER